MYWLEHYRPRRIVGVNLTSSQVALARARLAGRHLPDTQCGLRLMHLGTWAALPLKTERFEVESETLMAFLAAGCQVEFVPIRVIRSRRRSRIHPMTDSLRWWKWWKDLDWSSTSGAHRERHAHWLTWWGSRRIFRSR